MGVFDFILKYSSIKILNNVISKQSDVIRKQVKQNIELHNKLFNATVVNKHKAIYHGQIEALQGCRCLMFDKRNKKCLKTMLEVVQPIINSDNVNYYYFISEAAILEEDLKLKQKEVKK